MRFNPVKAFCLLSLLWLLTCCTAPAAAPVQATATTAQAKPTQIRPTQPAAAQPTVQPTAKPKPSQPAAQSTPAKGGSDASQNMSFQVPAHVVDVILGRPTDQSITLSVLASQSAEGYIEYGVSLDGKLSQSAALKFAAGQPLEVALSGLQPDTRYIYRVRYRLADQKGEFAATESASFQTQRKAGSSFTFTIQADSHLDSNSSLPVYQKTIENMRSDNPDFLVDLGDTFMTGKYQPNTAALPQYQMQRYCFSLIGQSASVFLALGNHDGEGTPRAGSGTDPSTWATSMRKLFFPNPEPNGFYTGNPAQEKTTGAPQDYYAWQWGDALFVILDPYRFEQPKKGSSAADNWGRSIGEAQYAWLKETLESSPAKWKFVFIHQLVGGVDEYGRGGVEVARYFEWGGYNLDGSWGFDQQRPGWGMPIHQLLVANHVTAVFHGHDHVFVRQQLDGILYQEVPQPSSARANASNNAVEYGYTSGDAFGSPGYVRVAVSPAQVMVDYVRTYLPADQKPGQQNGQVDFSYTIR